MVKDKSISHLARACASEAVPSSGRPPRQGEIGFVGLGHMGTAMAANLAAAGHRVIAYIRHADQMDKLVALGLEPTTEITNLFDCEVVVSMLPDDAAVRDVVLGREDLGVAGLASGLKRGAIHLSMSTISTSAASQLATEHARRGQGYVAAPVFGNPDAAKARQLFIVAAGAPADIERCQPLFDSLGQKTFMIGTDPGHANLVKLLGNMMTATTLEMLGEVVAVALKRGLDPKSFLDIMTSTMFGGRAHKIYGDKIVRQSYAAGFVAALGAQGCAPGARRGGKRGRPDAVGRRGARPADHRNRSRLCRSRLERARPDRCAGSGTQGRASRRPQLKIGVRLASIDAKRNPQKGESHGPTNRNARNNMELVDIPGTSLKVSRIALGTWAIGGWMWGGTDEAEAIRTIHAAVDRGIKLIDTAPVYGFGRSEEIVGKALAQGGRRKRAVIATKVGLDWKDGNPFRNASKSRIVQEVEDSLRRLRTDVIDIYQVHWPDPNTAIEETAEAMAELHRAGKIRAIGVSNFSPAQMEAFRDVAPLHTVQPPYNLFERAIEHDVLPYCRDKNIVTLVYGSLCRGLLSGRMTRTDAVYRR